MDSRSRHNPVRPLVIALCVVLILSLLLSCLRRRRAIAHRQQLLQQQQNPTTELGDVAYLYQYPPPPGTPSNTYQPPGAGQTMYSPPPGTPPMMSQSLGGGGGGYYPPMAGTGVDMNGQQQQTPSFPQPHLAYPPMPVAPSPTAGTGSSTGATTYVLPQDGSANLTNADIQEGVPAIPPPPYTATVPK
ncbi:hypothetical protein BG015_000581 [Linnemannia schmuckeri]|uniref:Uncharacterized protein n=1 Tax=Linnemannia schmuckeri TaxID=64567 RepID=A0A9P5RTM3_9FUNG|nr:hypothetical protein BG015_000581 [Linnemannia schmuckeri]